MMKNKIMKLMNPCFFSPDAMESFIEDAENEELGIEFSSSEEEAVQNEMYGKSNENDTLNLRYDDWFAKPGEHRTNIKHDPIENEIETEKVSLYYSKPKEDLSKFEKEQAAKQAEISKAEKYLLEEDETDLSKHQKKQLQMANKIKKLEEENLKTKSWLLSGETEATSRPVNSLLEEDLDYEYAAKLPPLITEEVTKNLEDIIKYRIKENAFDDVIKKEAKKEEEVKQIQLDSNKSKRSLAEIYEEDFKKSTGREKKREQTDEELNKKWNETQRSALLLYKSLFEDLDALVGIDNPKD